jgi:predicted nicotinamide N-methyase
MSGTGQSGWERETDRDPSRFNTEIFAYTLDEQDKGATTKRQIFIHEHFHEIGCRVWDTAVFMCKFMEHSVHLLRGEFDGRKVLEIGSGCGLVGMLMQKIFARCEVTMTERGALLEHLQSTIRLNGLEGSARAQELDWNTVDLDTVLPIPDGGEGCGYGVVIASDITIDPRDVPKILRLLRHAVRPGTVCYVGCVNQREAHEPFLRSIQEHFCVETVPGSMLHPHFPSARIVILRLTVP